MPFFVLLILASLCEAWPHQEEVDQAILSGRDLALGRRYDEAMRLFQGLVIMDTRSPVGWFYQALTLEIKMTDIERKEEELVFFAMIDSTVAVVQRSIQDHGRRPDDLFYLGMAYGLRGAHEARCTRWFSAFLDTRRGAGILREVVLLDSTLYDAYFGIGTYTYWRSRFTSKFVWLPFIEDYRGQGIASVQLAVERGRYLDVGAMSGLVWILVEEERFDEAVALARMLTLRFPEARIFRRDLAMALEKRGALEEARLLYEKMMTDYDAAGCEERVVMCLKALAEIAEKEGDRGRIAAIRRDILKYSKT
ncbi:MAG: tetratricopeptide repeat protein, partial [Candidatus Latescibacteria bacterium]|nr:tetratricopeptide repeat protein [Candidatus Latescibacterota bacterium]